MRLNISRPPSATRRLRPTLASYAVGFTSGIQDRDDPTLFCSRGGQHVSDRTGAAVQSVAAAETRHPSGYAVAMWSSQGPAPWPPPDSRR
jgi:hypothetical protein